MTRIILLTMAALTATPAAAKVPDPPQRPIPALTFEAGSGTTSVEAEGDWEGPTLRIYDSQYCDEMIAGECSLVTFTCDDEYGQGLGVSIDDVLTEELMEWLRADPDQPLSGIKITGIAEAETFGSEIMWNEMNGGWDVTGYVAYGSDPGLVVTGDRLSVSSPAGTVQIPLDEKNRPMVDEFVRLCARE